MEEKGTLPERVPWFGARHFAKKILATAQSLRIDRDEARKQLDRMAALSQQLTSEYKRLQERYGRVNQLEAYSVAELESYKSELQAKIDNQNKRLSAERTALETELHALQLELRRTKEKIAETNEAELLQEVGVYQYKHPLSDVVAYSAALKTLEQRIKAMTLKDGGAILSAGDWTVNGSAREGKAMVREYSKLMLRAFNAEAESLVRWLKPYKIDAALDRLKKSADTIERLGRTMKIRVSEEYFRLRAHELELTADFLQKQAAQKEQERIERERLREEQKAQREIEAERARLAKEREHHFNALQKLIANGDEQGAARMQEQLAEVDQAISAVDYRAANIRAGYVYLISNVGSFGDSMVKLGLTRRLNPMDRIRELSDASVPFNFDVHALFFSKDAVAIETAMHQRLASTRVNLVNKRREFFRATPTQVKAHLSELAGELLEFQEEPEALEYRQTLHLRTEVSTLPAK
ncbi:MAG: DUF4041 domain-containing protein [Pseudolabrys sp.]|nr:DUF4041 domain-containing protein [Pseudolabrys sp.]